MLEVKDLHCSYGTTQVLKGVDLNVNKGEVISILGSSGSGKTTLLRCISFLQKADSGTIRFDNFEKGITQLKHSEIRALRMKMGYVFQNFNLFRNMTVTPTSSPAGSSSAWPSPAPSPLSPKCCCLTSRPPPLTRS